MGWACSWEATARPPRLQPKLQSGPGPGPFCVLVFAFPASGGAPASVGTPVPPCAPAQLVSTCLHEPGAPVSLCAREARPIQVLCPIAGAGEGLGVLPGRGQKGAHPGDTHPRPKSSRTSGNCTGPGGRRCRDTLRPREVERAGAVSVRAPRRRLHPGSLLQRQRRRPCLSSSSSFSLASASSFPSVLPGCLRCSRRGARSPRRAPGLAVPCCPGGGVEGWRRRCLRPPRGTCGCCGCCSPPAPSPRPRGAMLPRRRR
ncbi:PREDICTED: translation initiation factor IF-2-like [Rhinopithecus bieti]|uniref:translation initiation factor IF-2-like n=1 Tax=Rhinopithecus bieti TaxID=61621 RepID=UPI00083C1606|nr:PREDICTED: translation initiation factor IF-2-like [Rhinopithecus bieti]